MSIYHLKTSPKAKNDLKEIFKYIANQNVIRARTFIKELRSYLEERLQYLPFSGKVVKKPIRILIYKRYAALYIVDEEMRSVKILHIFAGGLDWENKLIH